MRNAMKKFVAVVLTVAMMLSLVTVAFAVPTGHDLTLRDHRAPVSLTIHHWTDHFLDPDGPYVWSPWATPMPDETESDRPFQPGWVQEGVEEARWHAIRLNAPNNWAGNTIPSAVMNWFVNATFTVDVAATTGGVIGFADFTTGFPGGDALGWTVSSQRITGYSDSDGVVHWSPANLQLAVEDYTATAQLTNPGRAQGMWLVWEEYWPGGPHTGEDSTVHAPFLVNLPTFVHRPHPSEGLPGTTPLPNDPPHLGGSQWVVGGSPDVEYLYEWVIDSNDDLVLVPVYDGPDRVVRNRPGYWVYHVNVFPKPPEPPILEKEHNTTRPGMYRPYLGGGEYGPYTMYTILNWDFRVGIPAELGSEDRYPVNNPSTRSTPVPLGTGANLPPSVTGHAPATHAPGVQTNLPTTPNPDAVPYFTNRYGVINQESFAVVRDVLDWRLRLVPDSVSVTFDVLPSPIPSPLPSPAPAPVELPRTNAAGTEEHWVLVNHTFQFDLTDLSNVPNITVPNNVPGVPTRTVVFCPDKHAAGMDQSINVFWIHLTEAGRQYVYDNNGRVFDADETEEYGFIHINFDTIANIVTDETFQGAPSDNVHGPILNEGTLNFGRDPMVNSNDRDPDNEWNEPYLLAIRIYKVNPSRDNLDGAVFYLWHEDAMTGDGSAADPFRPIVITDNTHPLYGLFQYDGDYVYPPIRRAISGAPGNAMVTYLLGLSPPGIIPPPRPAVVGPPMIPAEMFGQGPGEARFEGLPPGRYFLMEYSAPPGGYRRIDGWREVVLDEILDGYVNPGNDYAVQIYVTNTRDFDLPLTGGAGTIMFTAAGVSLMGGAGLFLFLARKKEKGRK